MYDGRTPKFGIPPQRESHPKDAEKEDDDCG
jgi:hypothetical protein